MFERAKVTLSTHDMIIGINRLSRANLDLWAPNDVTHLTPYLPTETGILIIPILWAGKQRLAQGHS